MNQSYVDGKPSRLGCKLPMSNEDWQFERPWLSVAADGTVHKTTKAPKKMSVQAPKTRPIAEFLKTLSKEEEDLNFIDLPMEKQIELVAEEYNKGTSGADIKRKLGINGTGTYYDRLAKAREIGLIKTPEPETVVGEDLPKTSVDDFGRIAADKLELAERLAREAERLQQAGHIALALTELLGTRADHLVSALFDEINT